MNRVRASAVALLLVIAHAQPARADVTAFIGANTTPANRPARGLAIGMGLLIVGFEFEYANTADDPDVRAPSLTTGMANVLLQTPIAFMGIQPYITAGAGVYRETLGTRED